MSQIKAALQANAEYVTKFEPVESRYPSRNLAVVTCMDARIDVFAALGLHLGDAHVIRNAGGRVTDDVLRSLALSVQVLKTDAVIVMQHTKCGLAGVTDDQLRAITGADIGFLPIGDHRSSLEADVSLLAETDYLSPVRSIAGFVFDVDSGRVEEVVRWNREQ